MQARGRSRPLWLVVAGMAVTVAVTLAEAVAGPPPLGKNSLVHCQRSDAGAETSPPAAQGVFHIAQFRWKKGIDIIFVPPMMTHKPRDVFC